MSRAYFLRICVWNCLCHEVFFLWLHGRTARPLAPLRGKQQVAAKGPKAASGVRAGAGGVGSLPPCQKPGEAQVFELHQPRYALINNYEKSTT